MSDPNNILPDNNDMNDDLLKDYLNGNLSEEAIQDFEKQMSESEFVQDAVEGLQTFSSEKKIQDYVQQLNKNLHTNLNHKKNRKDITPEKNYLWIIFSILIVLLLCFMAYMVISMQKHKEQQPQNPQTNEESKYIPV